MVAASLRFEVTPDDTARALGSGDVEVLATPRLLAWCEAATVAALATEAGGVGESATSVGTRVRLDHLAATPVGGVVDVTATIQHRDGRLVRFDVGATDRSGRVVATGEIYRVVVERERFEARVPAP